MSIKQSIETLEEIGISDYAIANWNPTGGVKIFSRHLPRRNRNAKPRLPLAGNIYANYDNAFSAILAHHRGNPCRGLSAGIAERRKSV